MCSPAPTPVSDVLMLQVRSHPFAVRDLLRQLMQAVAGWDLQSEARVRLELVAAEALNNVFEHACGSQDGISIELNAELHPLSIDLHIVDQGNPMPNLDLPKQAGVNAVAPDVNVPLQDLPEGGWGWMLIRDLTQTMSYERRNDANHLCLTLSRDIPVS